MVSLWFKAITPKVASKVLFLFLELGFIRCEEDHYVYIRCIDDHMLIFSLYVDDMLFFSNTKGMLSELKAQILGAFEMKYVREMRY